MIWMKSWQELIQVGVKIQLVHQTQGKFMLINGYCTDRRTILNITGQRVRSYTGAAHNCIRHLSVFTKVTRSQFSRQYSSLFPARNPMKDWILVSTQRILRPNSSAFFPHWIKGKLSLRHALQNKIVGSGKQMEMEKCKDKYNSLLFDEN